ncbi:hypothetical protein ASF80_11525 [Microbacterium sp. Leaf159]|nr:hypothetical protein ASF80_11525 [Microbacterium sp. Leaf159]
MVSTPSGTLACATRWRPSPGDAAASTATGRRPIRIVIGSDRCGIPQPHPHPSLPALLIECS